MQFNIFIKHLLHAKDIIESGYFTPFVSRGGGIFKPRGALKQFLVVPVITFFFKTHGRAKIISRGVVKYPALNRN